MRSDRSLTIASLLSILFITLHLADDIVRGMEGGTLADLLIVPFLVLWLYGTVELAGRKSGYIIILVMSLLAPVIPVVHFSLAGGVAHGEIAASTGSFFFVWTQIALAVTSVYSVVRAGRGLWGLRRGA